MNAVRVMLSMMAVGAVAAAACSPSGADEWEEGQSYGQWRLAYHGHGSVSGDDEEVVMVPKSADSLDATHASLVLTNVNLADDIDFSVTLRTEDQVRKDPPNAWEVGWVLWNYRNDEHFYALALKPNGWELSKQDPAYPGNQRFLASGDHPTFPLNEDHRARITQQGNTITVYAEDVRLATFTDEETPYYSGAVGLYTEDAEVRFRDLDIRRGQQTSAVEQP